LIIWRVGWRWYMVALFLLPALTLVTIYLNVLLGAPAPSITSFGSWSSLLGAFACAALPSHVCRNYIRHSLPISFWRS
jgi:hypothetical protein